MKFSLKTLLFFAVTLAIASAGIVQPSLSRKRAAAILNQCSGVFIPRSEPDPTNPKPRWTIVSSIFGSGFVFQTALIAPTAEQGNALRVFLSQRRGLIGMETLTILSNKSIESKNYLPIKRLDDIRFLKIQSATLDRACLEAFANIEDLERLELLDCRFDPSDLAVLRRCPHLAWIHLNSPGIDQIKLDKSRDELPQVYVTFGDFSTATESN